MNQIKNKGNISYSADMTFKQFLALTGYLKHFDTIIEINKVPYFSKLKIGTKSDVEKAKTWIFNSWNTERILRKNTEMISIDDNYFALQWSFPQAYYSVFSLTLAFMYLKGQSVDTHTGVASKFGEFISEGKYPYHISFYQKGTKKNPKYKNIEKYTSSSSLSFDYYDFNSCQTQICQFLNGTREELLDAKRKEKEMRKRFITKKGKQIKEKERLLENDWEHIASKVGNTNILHLLYRKRIKSNYQDINTFNYEHLKAGYIHNCLISITNYMNLIHECYIYKMIGDSRFLNIYNDYVKQNKISFLDKRLETINNNI